MKLIRLIIGLAVIGGLGYVAVKVPLGKKTLWDHVRAIADTKESKELVDGVKDKAQKILRDDAGPARKAVKGGTDKLTHKERGLLRKLIKEKLAQEPKDDSGKKPR